MYTHQIEAWASEHADALAGFSHVPTEAPPERETGSARVARERREAADRQRRSRANRARAIEDLKAKAELDAAIAGALRTVLLRAGTAAKIRNQADLEAQRVSLFRIVGEAMTALVLDSGYDSEAAAKAVNDRLLR
ncbi:hypothetical protein ACLBXJ_15605 [Methylobacterium mesophilicum]